MKKIVIFDIDNTLTESRTNLDREMGVLLCALLKKTKVGIISGASFTRLISQVVSHIECKDYWNNLYLMPETGTEMFVFKNSDWERQYAFSFSKEKKEMVFETLCKVFNIPRNEVTKYTEDKGAQITFAGIGLDATLEEKIVWDPDHVKRKGYVKKLKPYLSGIQMTIGGRSSIDFTNEGVDKGFGVEKLMEYLTFTKEDIEFVGDALYEEGNDNAVIRLGEKAINTKDPEETKKIIRAMLKGVI